MPSPTLQYAGLLPRIAAFALDYGPIALYLGALVVGSQVVASSRPDVTAALFRSPLAGQASGFLLVTVPVSLYFALQEASPAQATWGKGRCRLQVVGVGGQRLRFARALVRTALKFVPWELALPITAGFVLVWLLVGANAASVALRDDHRALYDLIAGTAVVRGTTAM
jgi:uncharacterized RDD family membrane protein YckC